MCYPLPLSVALSLLRTPALIVFLPRFAFNRYGTSQDEFHLYMYMEFVSGGELFSHLRRAGRFTNDTGKFFAASIVLALQHLHALDIVYRDLKVHAQIESSINSLWQCSVRLRSSVVFDGDHFSLPFCSRKTCFWMSLAT
eukprot:SAG31_NODE_12168_length_962_cov_1.059096_1_plen_140_part_00